MALVLAMGLHWAALQTVAWATMLANNLRSDCLASAVSKTFDGMHPCCLCKAIAAAREKQRKSEAITAAVKMEFPPTAEKLNLFPPAQFDVLPLKDTFAESLSSKPLLPPPRLSPA